MGNYALESSDTEKDLGVMIHKQLNKLPAQCGSYQGKCDPFELQGGEY